MRVDRRLALSSVLLGLACAPGELTITPAEVVASESASQLFVLDGLDARVWLEMSGDQVRPVDDLRVRIGEVECVIERIGDTVEVRPSRALPVGEHEARLSARGREHAARPLVRVRSGPLDASADGTVADGDAGPDGRVPGLDAGRDGEVVRDATVQPDARVATDGGLRGDATLEAGMDASPFDGGDDAGLGSSGATVAAGRHHTCALDAAGRVLCWGRNDRGQLGYAGADSSTAVAVGGVPAATAVSAGEKHSCALAAARSVWCWGWNDRGQLGRPGPDSPSPVEVAGLVDVVAIAVGRRHTCALERSGAVWCWGSSSHGQLGDGTGRDARMPVRVSTLSAREIAAGAEHTCAIRVDGTLACWGRNDRGQLGDGTRTDRPSPVTVSSSLGSSAREMGCGERHSCARLGTGEIVCWGTNADGQLGLGGLADAPPTIVPGVGDAAHLALGREHTCAVRSSGGMYCWGRNADGQLGDGTTTTRRTPTIVPGIADAIGAGAGWDHTCAWETSSLRCWGHNADGQLGDGTRADRSAPVTVIGL